MIKVVSMQQLLQGKRKRRDSSVSDDRPHFLHRHKSSNAEPPYLDDKDFEDFEIETRFQSLIDQMHKHKTQGTKLYEKQRFEDAQD